MEQDGLEARPGRRRIDRATRWAGVLLCWAHGTAMVLTVTEAAIRPTAGWWAVTWALTAALFITWTLLRAAQKRFLRRIAGTEGEGGEDPRFPEEPTHYDRAA